MKSICFFLIVILFKSCTGGKENNSGATKTTHTKEFISVNSPKQNEQNAIGQNINIELAPDDSISIDSVVFHLNNSRVSEKTSALNFFKWEVKAEVEKTGHATLKIDVFFNDTNETKYINLVFLSDIVPQKMNYKILNTYKHEVDAYTQGLAYEDGFIYEGTGSWGKSRLMKYNPSEHKILSQSVLSSEYFGEGIALFDDKIVQVTWRSQKGFVYDKTTFEKIRDFSYPYYEGWGITYDGAQFLMSDGSNKIYILDKNIFSETGSLEVYDNNGPVTKINELEYVNGKLYANVFLQDYIICIDPNTGKVTEKIDLSGLLKPDEKNDDTDVLNGIAYNPDNQSFFVTGKNWPKLFEIKIF